MIKFSHAELDRRVRYMEQTLSERWKTASSAYRREWTASKKRQSRQLAPPALASRALLHPLRDKQIHLVPFRLRAAGGPDQVLAVGAEDAEAVEAGRGRDALRVPDRPSRSSRGRSRSPSSFTFEAKMIRFPSFMKYGQKFAAPLLRDLALVRAVGVHQEQLHVQRLDEILRQQRAILVERRDRPDDWRARRSRVQSAL